MKRNNKSNTNLKNLKKFKKYCQIKKTQENSLIIIKMNKMFEFKLKTIINNLKYEIRKINGNDKKTGVKTFI